MVPSGLRMSRASASPPVERRQSSPATPGLPDGSYRVAVERPEVRGKFLFRGDEKVYVKGVTYGTFRPDPEGYAYPSRDQVDRDFAGMAANGVNAVRTYTVPPRWLLDLARQHGLLVMVGFAWEHHVAFLDDRGRAAGIEERLRQ